MATDIEGSTMSKLEALLTPRLTQRLEELRRCSNIRELYVISVDQFGNRAVVLLVPGIREDSLTDSDWQQPSQPFMMLIDSAALLSERSLH